MSDIKKFILGIYQTAIQIIYGKTDSPNEKHPHTEQKMPTYTYIPICTEGNCIVPLKDYFQGKLNEKLLKAIEPYPSSRNYDKPLYSSLYEASFYLYRHGARRRKSRYILIINETFESTLHLLRDGKGLHDKILGAVNHEDLINFMIAQSKDPLSPESYKLLDLVNTDKIEFIKNESNLTLSTQASTKPSINCSIL